MTTAGRAGLAGRLAMAEKDFESGESQRALIALAGIVRDYPADPIATERLVNALRSRNFLVPTDGRESEKLLPADASIRPDGTRLVGVSRSGPSDVIGSMRRLTAGW